ncbi:MAG: aminotransferase class I/II-fold pyridoxal phosphate-dependent enzyme [Pseudanabaenaceae cyanobacterium SKYGB_i_bin29]|nr:aminotransferase class I/II-fold pyridoxal phosphate-dependent enzyme [Pseudanabaenaceae cyanobacterium SKYG29]MDW8420859.1 aminotransferase class I/II-fold pyridoxal phosphate-dependent enzyme [Pseudanabaenaceae cyanobacterium SKYGB_i_bin29]
MPSINIAVAKRAQLTQESQIREASRYCDQFGAINLAQGLPDFPAPEMLKQAAVQAILADHNQYCDPWGLADLRQAIAQKMLREQHIGVDPDREVTVCCGATEGLNLALLSLIDPGDRVLLFEPFYENYLPNLITCGGIPEFVLLQPPHWQIDETILQQVFSKGIKAVILNTPANPTGKVWRYEELELLARYCLAYDVYVITDEIYEYIIYDGKHISMITVPGMRERTILVGGFSKTFCVTGWRLGYTIACPALTAAMRKLHDFLTICAPSPLQVAALTAMQFGSDYFVHLGKEYQHKRDLLFPALTEVGLRPFLPQGAYYIWADATAIAPDGEKAARYLAEYARIAAVPGKCFSNPDRSVVPYIRFCFAKKDSTLVTAVQNLLQLKNK